MAQLATIIGNIGHLEGVGDKWGSGNFAGFSRLV